MTRVAVGHIGAETIDRLVERLDKRSRRRPGSQVEPDLVHRLEIEIDPIDPLVWLASQSAFPRAYWQSRESGQRIAALGVADILVAKQADDLPNVMNRAAAVLQASEDGLRYFGGIRFDVRRPEALCDPSWRDFELARLVAPRFEIVSSEDRCYLTCNIRDQELSAPTVADIINTAQQLQFDTKSVELELVTAVSRHDHPSQSEWHQQIDQVLDMVARGESEKLVLARQTGLDLDSKVNPWHLLRKLRDQSENCFVFGAAYSEDSAFIGASPECMYRRDAYRIFTEAVAGTRGRGTDARNDDALAAELANSLKEQREHELVVDGILAGLDSVCDQYSIVDSRAPLRLQTLRHLATRMEGQLRSGVDDFQILAALHPSPAVGGYPTERAVSQLRGCESFDRGWYAGPVGWVARNRAEFAVAIRSALIHGNQIELFAGAGIVPGSEPESEWSEIECKIRPFLRLFRDGVR